jgi:hypothetical protein
LNAVLSAALLRDIFINLYITIYFHIEIKIIQQKNKFALEKQNYTGRVFTKTLGEPVPTPESTLGVPLLTIQVLTVAGVVARPWARTKAATPATWGVAMEVPLMVYVEISSRGIEK